MLGKWQIHWIHSPRPVYHSLRSNPLCSVFSFLAAGISRARGASRFPAACEIKQFGDSMLCARAVNLASQHELTFFVLPSVGDDDTQRATNAVYAISSRLKSPSACQ